MRSTLIAAIPLILSAHLLLGQRTGEPEQSPAHQIDGTEIVRRGEDMHAGPGEMKAFEVNGTKIYLAENTTVTLLESSGIPVFALREGRMVILDSAAETRVRSTTVKSAGTTSFVFYSWKDQLDVHAITGSTLLIRDGVTTEPTPRGFSVNTLDPNVPITLSPIFDPETSAASDFYFWALPFMFTSD